MTTRSKSHIPERHKQYASKQLTTSSLNTQLDDVGILPQTMWNLMNAGFAPTTSGLVNSLSLIKSALWIGQAQFEKAKMITELKFGLVCLQSDAGGFFCTNIV